MGVKIYVPAGDVWSFFQSNIDRLKDEMVAIAENEETNYVVYLTEDKGYPSFSVCKGENAAEYEEGAINESDCEDTAKRCYVRFLFPVVVNNEKGFPKSFFAELEDDEDTTEQDRQDNIYVREDELRLAMCDFLQVALNLECDPADIMTVCGSELVADTLDYILEYIGLELGLEVYRPMFITDEESGCEIYTEYPYDSSVDDGDDSGIAN